MAMNNHKLTAQRVVQNNREFLISVISVRELQRYTRYTERVITGFDDDNLPIYNNQIQRKTDTSKVDIISNYLIYDPDAMFPTNIVLAIPSFVIDEFVESLEGKLSITFNQIVEEELRKQNGDVYISVIDGQHRLKGLEMAFEKVDKELRRLDSQLFLSADEKRKKERFIKIMENLYNFQVPITFFIDPTLEYQASIFSTINRTQTKVSESLVYSLFGLTDRVSPQRSALEITLSLNSVKSSPFYNRIKLVGNNYKRGESPPLTQAAMVKSILKCICPSSKASEIERFIPRKELLNGINPELCFRKYYAQNNDLSISKIMFAYFQAVKDTFKDQAQKSYWDLDSTPNILQTTVGYETLLNILKLILAKVKPTEDNQLFEIGTYKTFLEKAAHIDFSDFSKFPKTSASKTVLLDDLKNAIFE